MTLRVWIADADPVVRAGLERVLAAAGHLVRVAPDGVGAIELRRGLAEELADLALVDVALFEPAPPVPTIVLAAADELPSAVEALGRGACDLLEKPCGRAHVLAALERVRRIGTMERDRARLADELAELHGASLIGRSPALRRVEEQLERAARTPRTTVLLRGEAGVEKERVARALHRRSARAAGPFVVCRAAVLEREELERELFGRHGTAVTPARAGLVAAAEGGTLYLDDIDELPLAVQARLLCLLHDRAYRVAGSPDGGAELRADVRVVAGTGGRLEEQVERGAFREDLFYRVNVLTIVVPALRERGDDVLELARDVLRRKALACGRAVRGFTPAAEALLAAHRWPGNLRELENVVERAVLFARAERIDAPDLALHGVGAASPTAEFLPLGDRSLRALETALIRRVLAEVDGNKSRAAERLGINRATLYNKLQALELDARASNRAR